MHPTPPRIRFDSEVREALIRRRGNFRRIAKETGISYSWLSKFASGHIPNPGVAMLNKLADLFATGTV